MGITGAAHATIGIGLVTAVGGVAGYAMKRSARSLGAGVFFGGAFAYAAHLISEGEPERGFRYASTASAVLAGAMGFRAVKYSQRFPAGGLAALGALSLAYHGAKWYEYQK